MSQVKATPIYGNWKMLGPAGNLMCRCDDKRANWYLRRGLAEDLGDNTIKLKFEPDGPGNADAPFLLEEKQNVCVVCGSDVGLNRHHIVPYQYRKHMPLRQKAHTSYDVIPICLDHHHEYEELAQQHAYELGQEFNAPFNPLIKLTDEQVKLRKMLMHARVLLKEQGVPPERRLFLRQQIAEYLGKPAGDDVLKEFIESSVFPSPQSDNKSHGQVVVEKVLADGGLDGLHEFIKRWRRHFVETMKPQFLSPSWDIEYART